MSLIGNTMIFYKMIITVSRIHKIELLVMSLSAKVRITTPKNRSRKLLYNGTKFC